MNKIISIIIPTFNMEKYLRKGLDSLLIPDLQDIEVIIVNDGSTDSSPVIANEYVKKYPETFKVINKENGHYGSCINRGLKEVSGKYVKIMDADDSFDTANFEEFVNLLKDIDVDLVISAFLLEYLDGSKSKLYSYKYPVNNILSSSELIIDKTFWAMHAVTFRSSIFKEISYRQTEGIPFTDYEWTFTPMQAVNSFYYFDKPVYKYLIGRPGQTVDPEYYARNLNHVMTSVIKMIEDYNKVEGNLSDSIKNYLWFRLLHHTSLQYFKTLISYYPKVKIDYLWEFDKKIHQINKRLYDELENIKAPILKIPYYYIRHWRKHKDLKGLSKLPFELNLLKNKILHP